MEWILNLLWINAICQNAPCGTMGSASISTKVMQGNHFHTIHTHNNITNLPKTKVCAIEKAFYVK